LENEGEDIEVDDGDDPNQNNTGDKLEEEEDLGQDLQALEKIPNVVGTIEWRQISQLLVLTKGRRLDSKMLFMALCQKTLRKMRNKVFGMEQSHIPTHAMVLRSAEDNIEESLLQKFDAESHEETNKAAGDDIQKTVSEDQPD
jgi:hypothetical protein